MEDVLAVYQRPYDPRRPVVCLDETSRQLLGETRAELPAAPGQSARQDYEYERHGTANLFMLFEPLAGWRHVPVTERRTRQDWARVVKELLDGRYAAAEKVVLVQDNLNTHSPASLYATFAPAEARRLAERLELHYTPKHGSWLNMAEVEFSALARTLSERLERREQLEAAATAWSERRNHEKIGVNWQFTTADARIKLKRLYPTIEV
jgi:transposase